MTDWKDIGNLKDDGRIFHSSNSPKFGNNVSSNSKGDIITVSIPSYEPTYGANLVLNYNGGQSWNPLKDSSNYYNLGNTGIISDVSVNSNASISSSLSTIDGSTINGNIIIGLGNSSGNEVLVKKYDASMKIWNSYGASITGSSSTNFGFSVSLNHNGDRIAVGAPAENTNVGAVRVYNYSTSNYSLMGSKIDGAGVGAQAGYSVALNYGGDIVVTGQPYYDLSAINERGIVQVFSFDGSSWSKLGSDIVGTAASDNLGWSVAINSSNTTNGSGTISGTPVIAIGVPGKNSNKGLVQVYEYGGSSWSQRGSDIEGESASDFFGYSVSLNGDGSIISIGAKQDGYSSNGYVKNYEWGTSWTLKGSKISGTQAGEEFGNSVSLNGTGLQTTIGVPKYNTTDAMVTNNNIGRVNVYEYASNNRDTLFYDLKSSFWYNCTSSFFNTSSAISSGIYQPSSDGFINADSETSIEINNDTGGNLYYDFFDGSSLPDPYTKFISSTENINQDGSKFISDLQKNRILISGSPTGAHSGIILDIANLLCLAPFTLIKTKKGLQEIRELKRGDEILTLRGYKKLAKKVKTALLNEKYVKFPQNCFKPNVPERDLYITKDHPFALGLKKDNKTLLWLEAQEFINKLGIEEIKLNPGPSYNLIFDDQETFYAEGLKVYSHHPNGIPYILRDEDFIGEPKREERKLEKVYWNDLIKNQPEDMDLNNYIGNLLKFN